MGRRAIDADEYEIKEDLTGRRFGHYTVMRFYHYEGYQEYWICRCDCGQELAISKFRLMKGLTTSCGCGYSRRYTVERKSLTWKKVIEINGRALNFYELSAECGVSRSVLLQRYRRGDRGRELMRPVEAQARGANGKFI